MSLISKSARVLANHNGLQRLVFFGQVGEVTRVGGHSSLDAHPQTWLRGA
jgi:hypothetical protein